MTSAIETIRNKRDMFLIPGMRTAESICISLVHTALKDDVGPICVYEHAGFFFVGASTNWIIKNYQNKSNVFDRLVPLNGQQNTFRGEILLPAFATAYALIEDGVVIDQSNDTVEWGELIKISEKVGRFCIVFTSAAINF